VQRAEVDTNAAPAGSRASRRRARTRQQVLDVAEKAVNGGAAYRDVRMEDLAEAADVSVGSIYGHFGSKGGLYLALAERALERFAEYLDQAFRPEYSPLEQVLAAGDVYLRFHLEHPGSFRFLAFAGVETNPAQVDDGLRERVGAQLAEIVGGFQERIEAALTAGEMDSVYDARLTARFLWGAWNGVVFFSLRNDQMALTDDEIAACLQLGRRLVSEGFTARGFRDADGRSRARLIDTGPPRSHATA
jgi:TetR/AcrR family transcriptional regulator